MTAGTDALKQAWRDWITDSIPATGPNNPNKAEIRLALDRLAIDIAGSSTGDPAAVIAALTDAYDRLDALEAVKSLRIVQTYGERDSIPPAERFPGMLVKVVQGQGNGDGTFRALWFEVNPDIFNPSSPPSGNAGWRVAPEFVDNWVAFRALPIIDAGQIYFPAFYVLRLAANGYTLYSPTAPNTYVSSPVQMGVGVRRHVFDQTIYDATGSLESAIIEVDDAANPLRDTNTQVVLAVTSNGRLIDSRDYTFVGDVPGGAVANQFDFGQQMDDAPFIFPGASVQAVTREDWLALGIAQGVRAPANVPTTVGDYRDTPIKAGDYIVARFKLMAETDGQFGIPSVIIYTSEGAINAPLLPVLLREISPSVREYYYAGRATLPGVGKWAVGSNTGANAGAPRWVADVQFYCSSSSGYWIGSGDFPAPSNPAPLLPDDIYLVSDRPLPIYPANGLAQRSMAASVEMTTSPAVVAPDPAMALGGDASAVYLLDPVEVGTRSLVLSVRSDESPDVVWTKAMLAHTLQVPLASPININGLYLGDSHSHVDSGFPVDLRDLLAAWGINVTFYGTLENGIGAQKCEGRPSWSLMNFMGYWPFLGDSDFRVWDTVLGAGAPATAAYLAGDYALRFRTNPFLSNDAGSASLCPVIAGSPLPLLGGGTASGFRADLALYRDRMALPTIHVVWNNLWSNDMNRASGLADVTTYTPYWLAEIRRAFPAAEIIDWADTTAFVNNAELRWKVRRPALQAIIAAVRAKVAAGDTKMHFCGAYLHRTVRGGLGLGAGVVDPVTGVSKARVDDDVHGQHPANLQAHGALAATTANVVGA